MKKEVCDVLVIGSGGAGLRTAIELKDRGIDVLVVGKCKKRDAHTILATGGINAALGNLDPKDRWEIHAADTIRDGGGINDPKSVEILCKNAPRAIKELAKWGCPFHKEKNGKISQRFFGAATYRRACFVGDTTGKAILNTLVNQTLKRKIRFKSEIYITSLLKKNNRVNGALGINIRSGKLTSFQCKAVILCAGGHSRMFKRSSSRFWENNGDGIALSKDSGATFMDMEMFQFHPTGMVWPKIAQGILVTEAVRGEGGILTNTKGERFMKKYDSKRLELSARDIVARSIYTEISQGRGTKRGGVYLDITNKSKAYIKKRLPRMFKQFKEHAKIDISKTKMEVAPTAHYSMGGILVNHNKGQSTVPGLYAVGEVTSGIHGGNRLGGNSLAELCVFGRLTGECISKDIKDISFTKLDDNLIEKKKNEVMMLFNNNVGKNPIDVKWQIQQLMWKAVGVVRTGETLKTALSSLKKLSKTKLKVPKGLKMNEKLIAALDIQNMIPTCEMIILSALYRKESRAAHFRSDFPNSKKSWRKNIVCTPLKNGKIKLLTKPIPSPSKRVQRYLTQRSTDNKEHHMLE
jgi:succinate dehydrogenase / fumarate reductase, flavoprotein subunit